MKTFFVKTSLALSLVTVMAAPVVWADVDSPVVIQRSFVNAGFEDILDSTKRNSFGDVNKKQYGCYPQSTDGSHSKWITSYCIFAESQQVVEGVVKGWRTTTNPKHASADTGKPEIELWRAGEGIDSNNTGINPPAGTNSTIYAELNAHESAALYQNICISKNDSFSWSLQHASRVSTSEKMSFFITNQLSSTITGQVPSSASKIPLKVGNSDAFGGGTVGSWVTYGGQSGTAVSTSNILTEAPKVMSFVFQAEQTSNAERGNWIDNIKVDLKPAVEFSAKNASFDESNGEEQSIKFKIVGLIESSADMPTLDFKIEYDANVELGNRLVYGTDYVIYKRSGEQLVELTTDELVIDRTSRGITFKYKPVFKPGLDYAQGVEINDLMVEFKNNTRIEGNKTLPIYLNLNENSSAVAMSLSTCGGEVIKKFELEVIEDDVDMAVTKNMLTDQSTFANNNLRVSYEINVINNSRFQADQVRLTDELLANLEWDGGTSLICLPNSENTVCPTLPSDALTQLFGGGLTLGSMPGNAQYKFVLSNLKLKSADENKTGYAGLVVNKAIVSSNGSDINPEDNDAIAQNLYPAKNDLMNGHAELTGQGVFVIEQGGNALWTQVVQNDKVYFPLKIKNHATLSQDYQLYASPTPIQPSILNQELSSLKQETISAYTEKLNVAFYEVVEGQCNPNIPAARHITQLNVAGGATGEVCAVISVSASANPEHDIWFAIESIQTGLGDIIRDKIVYSAPVLRQLVLVNDQQAQVNIGGAYVFAHRLTNEGTIAENDLKFSLNSLSPQDDFNYTLFLDKNNDGVLDGGDEQVKSTTVANLAIGERLALLVKVQAPVTATNGMRSQVELIVTPVSNLSDILLEPLTNIDTIVVGSDQLALQKTQFKQENCINMTAQQVKDASYSLGKMSIGRHDCIIYRIEAKNIGAETLKSVVINDMYPHYSTPWFSNGILPMTDSGDAVDDKNGVNTTITELLPGEKKSLYFGIRLQ